MKIPDWLKIVVLLPLGIGVAIFGYQIEQYLRRQAVRDALNEWQPLNERQPIDAWGEWFDEHAKTCPECGGSPDHAMCVEAFTKFQTALKESK